MKDQAYDPQAVFREVLNLEQRFPVNNWRINGIEFWPFIRTSLAYTQRVELKQDEVPGKQRRSRVIRQYARTFVKLPFHIVGLIRSLRNADRVFVGAITHRIRIAGKMTNRYFDASLADFNQNGGKAIILDLGVSLDSMDYPNQRAWFSLPSLYVATEALRKIGLFRVKCDIQLDGYDAFYQHLVTNFKNPAQIKAAFSEAGLRKKMTSFIYRKEMLKRQLQHSSVSFVYILCYYSSMYYPLIQACNELGISTVDVQHGGMGAGHWSYDRWNTVPPHGYSMLPRFFWTWDASSMKLISNWASRTDFHRSFNVGTPWVHDLRRMSIYRPAIEGYVLYIMTDVTLEPYIAETIAQLGEQCTWVLRLHPRMVDRLSVLENSIKAHGLEKFVRIEDSNKVSLTDSLQFSSAVISAASGSVVEAIQFGLQPILLASPGFHYFQDYVDAGHAVTLTGTTASALVAALDTVRRQHDSIARPSVGTGKNKNPFLAFEEMTERES